MKTFLTLLLALLSLSGLAQNNILVADVRDYGMAVKSTSVTLTLLSPNPRTYNGVLVSQQPVSVTTGTNGIGYFTNILWGSYRVDIGGNPVTKFQAYIQTNTTGTVSLATLVTSPQAVAPNPATNYYTMPQVDALIAGIEIGTNAGIAYVFSNTNLPAGVVYTNGSSVLIGTNQTATSGDISATSSNNIVAQVQSGDSAGTNYAASATAGTVFVGAFTTNNNGLVMAVSGDGQRWDIAERSINIPAGYEIANDSILRVGPRDYLMVTFYGTNANCYSCWQTGFGVFRSTNLLNWNFVTNYPVGLAGLNQLWAPELHMDTDGSIWCFFAASLDNGGSFSIYACKSASATYDAWTAPTPIALSGVASAIDPFVFRENGTNYLWYVNSAVGPYIEVAASASLTNGYTVIKSGNWAGWGGNTIEAPNVHRRGDGKYVLIADAYNSTHLSVATSTNLLTGWSTAIPVVSPKNADLRHGTARAIPASEAGEIYSAAMGGGTNKTDIMANLRLDGAFANGYLGAGQLVFGPSSTKVGLGWWPSGAVNPYTLYAYASGDGFQLWTPGGQGWLYVASSRSWTFDTNVTVTGTLAADRITGNGASLTNIPGTALVAADWQLATNAPSLTGYLTTSSNLNATNLIGTIADARLSGNVLTNNYAIPVTLRGQNDTNNGLNLEMSTSTGYALSVNSGTNLPYAWISSQGIIYAAGGFLGVANATNLNAGTVPSARLTGTSQTNVTLVTSPSATVTNLTAVAPANFAGMTNAGSTAQFLTNASNPTLSALFQGNTTNSGFSFYSDLKGPNWGDKAGSTVVSVQGQSAGNIYYEAGPGTHYMRVSTVPRFELNSTLAKFTANMRCLSNSIVDGTVTASNNITSLGSVTATNFLFSSVRWDDAPIQFVWSGAAPAAPVLVTVNSTIQAIGFPGAGFTNVINGFAQISHRVATSNLTYYTEPHLHLSTTNATLAPGANGTNVAFQLIYDWSNISGVARYGPVTNRIETILRCPTNNMLMDFGHLYGTNYFPGISAVFRCNIKRVAATSNEFLGTIILDAADVHFPIDTAGGSSSDILP